MKRIITRIIVAVALAMTIAVVPFVETATNINILSISASAATTCRRISLTQAEYNAIISHWKNKGTSYLGRDLYPGAAKKLAVKDLQMLLNKVLGCNLQVDGLFGEGTRTQVLAFQRATGLYADGLFGNNSFNKLMSYANIKNEAAAISFNSMVTPSEMIKGRSYDIKGIIKSSKPLSYVTAQILNSNGFTVCFHTIRTSAYSLDIVSSALNTNMKFGSLSAGSYTLRYVVAASDGTSKTISYKFIVKDRPNNNNSQKLNMSAALNYANQYWNQLDPQNGFYTSDRIKTYDPSKFSTEGNNCANYVSAILLAAGKKTDSTWYRGSNAWVDVNAMRTYFKNKGISYIAYPASTQIDVGDILYTSSGHVMFVTSADWSGSRKIIKATGNTNSRIDYQVTLFYGVIKTSVLF